MIDGVVNAAYEAVIRLALRQAQGERNHRWEMWRGGGLGE